MGGTVERLLIANRGEIAVRVIAACRELGIEPLALHLPGEEHELHVELCTAALPIPSFLDAGAILEAAARLEADALHPGYGYLSESAGFAEAAVAAGLVWVGPPPAAIRAVGDKVAARRLSQAAGVPTVPGYDGVDLDDATLEAEAARLGFPLMVKAASGGGGRGIRRVDSASELRAALERSRSEAQSAFGDGRVYLERVLEDARHIEVQVLADRHGAAIHLGERDCSVQRRHQKLVEEAPSPAIDADTRSALGSAAVAIAKAAGYEGAGTAEFLLEADGRWSFLEMNARLQVEHAVTELVTGVDLVRAQLGIAAGEPLEWAQDEITLRGHAIECRIYAEDPRAGFVPAAGRLERFDLPRWPGVRIDTAARAGDRIGLAHDPLIAKVVAGAEDRDACLERMAAVLAASVILGVDTNLGFLRWLLGRPELLAGEADTGLVERTWNAALVPELPAEVLAGARTASLAPGPWRDYGSAARIDVPAAGGWVFHEGWQYPIAERSARGSTGLAAAAGSLHAPMPATVVRVAVAAGDTVEAGAELVVLEAMKMQTVIAAPRAGTVAQVAVAEGDQVTRDQRLVELD